MERTWAHTWPCLAEAHTCECEVSVFTLAMESLGLWAMQQYHRNNLIHKYSQ
jgi:hypothetical protein